MQSGEASVQSNSAEEGSTEEESSGEEEEEEKLSKVNSMAAYKPYIGINVMVCIKKNWWVERCRP